MAHVTYRKRNLFDKICTYRGEIDAPIQQILSFGVDFQLAVLSSDADFYPYTASMILNTHIVALLCV